MIISKSAVATLGNLLNKIETLPAGEFIVVSKSPNGDILVQGSGHDNKNPTSKRKKKIPTKKFVDLTLDDDDDDDSFDSPGSDTESNDDNNASDDGSNTDIVYSANIKTTAGKKDHHRASSNPNMKKKYFLSSDDDSENNDIFNLVTDFKRTRGDTPGRVLKKKTPPQKKTPSKKVIKQEKSGPASAVPMRKSSRLVAKKIDAPIYEEEKKKKKNRNSDVSMNEPPVNTKLEFDSDYSDDNQFSQQFVVYKKFG